MKNTHNIKARGLRAYLLGRLGRTEEAKAAVSENLAIDPFDYVSMLESAYLDPDHAEEIRAKVNKLSRNFHETYLMAARDFAEYGAYDKAVDTLRECSESWPMLKYYEAYDLGKMGASHEEILKVLKEAENCSTDYCFPNKLEDILCSDRCAETRSGRGKCILLPWKPLV